MYEILTSMLRFDKYKYLILLLSNTLYIQCYYHTHNTHLGIRKTAKSPNVLFYRCLNQCFGGLDKFLTNSTTNLGTFISTLGDICKNLNKNVVMQIRTTINKIKPVREETPEGTSEPTPLCIP